MNSDFKDLLRLFTAHNVRYLVVGGYAVMKHTEPRYTKDLDLWVEATPENARAVYRALLAFGAPLAGIAEEDFAREGSVYQMGRPPIRVDVLTSISGVRFSEAWPNRVATTFDEVASNIISRDDLLRTKQAAGRPQDLIDAANLMAAGDIQSTKNSST
jgi:hypothetical protein